MQAPSFYEYADTLGKGFVADSERACVRVCRFAACSLSGDGLSLWLSKLVRRHTSISDCALRSILSAERKPPPAEEELELVFD